MTNKEFLIKQWTSEIKATVNSIRTVPDTKSEYKPNTKTRSAHEMVSHLLGEINDMLDMLNKGEIRYTDAKVTTMAEAASEYETKSKEFLDKLSKTSEQDWDNKVIPMIFGDHKGHEATISAMTWIYFKDLIHHRGQLSTYFRPMGVANPAIYGPTAEMMEEMAAKAN